MKIRGKIVFWALVVVALCVGGWFFFASKKEQASFQTEKPVRRDLIQTVSVTGTVFAKNRNELAFSGPGKIRSVAVQAGDAVKKGQMIAQLDSAPLYAQLREAQKTLEIEIEQEKLMRRKWEDFKPEEREQQKLTVGRAEEAVGGVRAQLSETVLYSPIDGVVGRRLVDPQDVVGLGQAVVVLIGPGDFEIEADVPESDINKVTVGQKASVQLDAFEEEEIFETTVAKIDPSATDIQDVVYYRIKLDFSKQDGRLRDGMSADVDVLTAEKKNVLSVPTRSLSGSGGNRTVEVVRAENRTEKVGVKTGLKGDDGYTEIISGLSENDEVVISKKNGKE